MKEIKEFIESVVGRIEVKFDNLSDSLKEQRSKLDDVSDRFNNVEQVVWQTCLAIETDQNSKPLSINGNVLEIDYRTWSLFNIDKMIRCLIIRENWKVETKYTRWDYLEENEKKYYKKHGFVLVDTNK